jgi:hypothetical protein
MARLPRNAQLWKDRAELDYIGPFVKAWASFNAWLREETGNRSDRAGLNYVRDQANPVRAAILPLLQPRGNDLNGRPIRETEPAQEFKLLVAELHARLEAYRLEVFQNNALEQISFRSVCLKRGINLPQMANYRRITYTVNKVNGTWISVAARADGTEAIRLVQAEYSVADLIVHPNYVAERSDEKRDQLRNLYQQCNPRPISNLLVGTEPPIVAGDIEFRCLDTELFSAIIEVIYSMRNALLHGELQPEEPAFRAYEPAYRIIMKFLNAVG